MDDRDRPYRAALDRIVEEYSATPRDNPEFIAYSLRPAKKSRRSKRPVRSLTIRHVRKLVG